MEEFLAHKREVSIVRAFQIDTAGISTALGLGVVHVGMYVLCEMTWTVAP